MSKFYIVQVDYSDDTSEFEVRMKTGDNSVLITTRACLETALHDMRALEGKREVKRTVIRDES